MKNEILTVACISLFFINALLHLFWKKHQNLTKALILPLAVLVYVFMTDSVSHIIIAAAAASCAGDILLSKEGIKWFTAGGLAFIASHLLFGLSYIPYISRDALTPFRVILVAAIYSLIALSTVFFNRKGTPKNFSFLLFLYLSANSLMNILAFFRLLSSVSTPAIMIFAGAILFFISDNCLFYECFHPKKPNLFVPVMATYIAGEFLIIAGSALA